MNRIGTPSCRIVAKARVEVKEEAKEEVKEEAKEEVKDKEEMSPNKEKSSDGTQSSITQASPAARRMAREQGIDLQNVQTNDPIGRIRKQDLVQTAAKIHETKPEQANVGAAADKPTERIRMSRRRQTIAKHLVHAQQSAAMLTTFNEVDMTAILDLRKRHKESFQKKYQIKLGFMSFFH